MELCSQCTYLDVHFSEFGIRFIRFSKYPIILLTNSNQIIFYAVRPKIACASVPQMYRINVKIYTRSQCEHSTNETHREIAFSNKHLFLCIFLKFLPIETNPPTSHYELKSKIVPITNPYLFYSLELLEFYMENYSELQPSFNCFYKLEKSRKCLKIAISTL